MSSTNKTTYYELSQYVGTDKPTYLGDYNSDMLKIDTAIHEAADDASTAVSTANTANATATTASSNASAALNTANSALETANTASTTATTSSNNASAALTAAESAETAAAANTITNLAPAYDPTLTYEVGDLVTYIDEQGSGKIYKCIVAVSTPEAFNINKWDDVTASEVFQTKGKLISSVTGDGTTTRASKISELFSNVTIEPNKNYRLFYNNSSNNSSSVYNYAGGTVGSNDFKFSYITASNVAGNISIHLIENSATPVWQNVNIATDGTVTSSSLSSLTLASTATLELYEI